jgi:hypothetical protein
VKRKVDSAIVNISISLQYCKQTADVVIMTYAEIYLVSSPYRLLYCARVPRTVHRRTRSTSTYSSYLNE